MEDLRHLHQEHKDPHDEGMEEEGDRDVVPVDDEGDDDDEVD